MLIPLARLIQLEQVKSTSRPQSFGLAGVRKSRFRGRPEPLDDTEELIIKSTLSNEFEDSSAGSILV